MSRTIEVITDRGNFQVDCHGTFNVKIAGVDFMFAITSNTSGDKLQVVEYGTGLRWRVPFDHCVTDLANYSAIVDEAIAKINADTVLRGGEAEVAKVILAQQQRFKTNELDF